MPAPPAHDYDLLIRAGRVFCAESGLDGPGAVALKDGRIAAAGPGVDGPAAMAYDFTDAVAMPGLVDLHAHPARGGSRYGVDPDVHFLSRGVTTVMSQGDAGASNWPAYRDRVIRACRTRVILAINLSIHGESHPDYCLPDLEAANVDACVSAIESGGEAIWGIAANTGPSNPTPPGEIMDRALEASERSGKPLLVGTRLSSDWSLDDQLPMLRAGDVVTYCFNDFPESVVKGGRIRPSVRDARERGVLFDIGHGMRSFSFAVAEAAIADGFLPDTISTDQYSRHVGSDPQHDLPRTLSKLIAAGMTERDAFVRVTSRPAEVLGLKGEVGTLRVGACGDVAVLRWNEDAQPLRDVDGVQRPGGCWEPVLTARAGVV